MTKRTCGFPGCNRPHDGLGLCSSHRKQQAQNKPLTKLRTMMTPAERFWQRVVKGADCWVWVGNIDQDGYGRLRTTAGHIRAHKFSYELHHGPVPKGMVVRHLCHNRQCVNPSHLATGTAKDNVQDSIRDKRMAYGERHRWTKLAEEQVRAIYADPRPTRTVAEDYGVSISAVYHIRHRHTWKHLWQ